MNKGLKGKSRFTYDVPVQHYAARRFVAVHSKHIVPRPHSVLKTIQNYRAEKLANSGLCSRQEISRGTEGSNPLRSQSIIRLAATPSGKPCHGEKASMPTNAPRPAVETGSAYDQPAPSYDADLVSTAKGTPGGELLRRYWHPIAVASEVKDLPRQVRVLGEERTFLTNTRPTPSPKAPVPTETPAFGLCRVHQADRERIEQARRGRASGNPRLGGGPGGVFRPEKRPLVYPGRSHPEAYTARETGEDRGRRRAINSGVAQWALEAVEEDPRGAHASGWRLRACRTGPDYPG
jgi:hypothetical protein